MSSTWQRMLELANNQTWPSGALYVIATPIGNLADLTLRAAVALQKVDLIAAEDTRKAKVLCDAWGVHCPTIALHQHNERRIVPEILAKLSNQQSVALISDAGTPCISDPGAILIHEARQQGFQVIPLPGPCAALTAYMAIGSDEKSKGTGFSFLGFPPDTEKARKTWWSTYCSSTVPIIFYVAPHDLERYAKELQAIYHPTQRMTIAKELTKRYESIETFTVAELVSHVSKLKEQDALRGEFVVVIEPIALQPAEHEISEAVKESMRLMLAKLSLKDSVHILSLLTTYRTNTLYDLGVELKKHL